MSATLFDTPDFNARLFFPRRDTTPTPPGSADLFVPVPGASLHLRWHRAADARVTVLLFHGNGEVVADYDSLADSYAQVGASLAVADFRGYGASTGTPSLREAIEDAPRVLEALVARRPGPIVVMGRSLGSACANELYGLSPAGVVGVVLESGFTDLAALVHRRGLPPPAPASLEDVAPFDPLPKLRRGRLPLLVVHGSDDTLISPHEAHAAFEAAGTERKRLVLVPERGHNDLSESADYWRGLGAFVEEIMGA